MNDEHSSAVNSDQASWRLVAWLAQQQEAGRVDSAELVRRIAKEMEGGAHLTIALLAQASLLLRLYASAKGLTLEEAIAEQGEVGTLAALDFDVDEEDDS